jgi:hypothetical protein
VAFVASRPSALPVVYQQTQRWIAAGVFEDMIYDLRALLRDWQKERRNNRLPPSLMRACYNPRPKVCT